jgi:hypothetical protein
VKEPTVCEKKYLPPQQMPQNTVEPRGVQDCKLDVHYFIKLFGMNNFSEQEIRQVIGILLYMSVVRLPSIKLYWRKSLRNSMVADVVPRRLFIPALQ